MRALDTSPGNLRPATTSFIGRDSEVAEVRDALRAHRLVTLTGVGGVGKTRLGLEVAEQLRDEFPDGVWLFELAAVTDPAAVPDAVTSVLGITQQPGKTVTESVATATAAPSVPEFALAITHLREVLGEQTYASLALDGEAMTMAAMVTFALDQIDRVRRLLEQLR